MNTQEFKQLLQKKEQEIHNLIHKTMPVVAGEIAMNHFQDNFRRAGHLTGGTLHPWPKTRRQQLGDSRTPLLSERRQLMKSIQYAPGDARVRIFTDLPYASIHNYGGPINTHPTVTPKMRRFAWAMYKEKGGKGPEADKWKALALTKKKKLNIRGVMPQRMFLNDAPEVTTAIKEEAYRRLNDIFK